MKLAISHTPLQKVEDPEIADFGVNLYVKREDLIHPTVSGNKWRKLKYNLEQARKEGFDQILTYGGAYSNHIYATASAGKLFDIKSIGVIRGEPHEPLNDTLSFAKSCGMRLHYMDREKYRQKNLASVIGELKERFGKFYLIPEGGSNALAVKGCAEIVADIDQDFDYICCACGTGGTLAGIIAGLHHQKKALGFAALKGAGFLKDEVSNLILLYNQTIYKNWDINMDYHFGGYAKSGSDLQEFMKKFEKHNKIPLEFIYTGKMMFGIYDLIKKGFFKSGETIIAIHTGGIR
ncbi:1-aminocyclopropane-1-carboxylate deaminase/D-cysteine desulfhydrase [Flexithrix dorotheae]|uniref:1-aminocyclopropane-1-carboxylate deaminase/D-cysteine desulfhydrase n=1 Tax=Flexithrix dorotheae TaxID=70993 RepID=UPI0003A91157|nr:pyridoxal-phosphate dependent enzyme [Flexithrix dorotheae]